MIFFGISCTQPTVTVCCRCYKKSKKASKKDLAHPENYLERFLRPIHATQVIPWPFWTRQKKLEPYKTSNKNVVTWNIFSIEGAPQFTELLKQLCPVYPLVIHCRLVQDPNHIVMKKIWKKYLFQIVSPQANIRTIFLTKSIYYTQKCVFGNGTHRQTNTQTDGHCG